MPEKAGPSAEEAVEDAGVGDGVGFGTKTGFVVGTGKQAIIFIFDLIFRRLVCLKYVKKRNVLIFGSNHIKNNVQKDLINSPNYQYIGYISDNKSRATEYLIGRYDDMEKII